MKNSAFDLGEFVHVCASDYCAELPGMLVLHASCQPSKGIEMGWSLIVFRGKVISREHRVAPKCVKLHLSCCSLCSKPRKAWAALRCCQGFTNGVHLAVSFQCKHWAEVDRAVRHRWPFCCGCFSVSWNMDANTWVSHPLPVQLTCPALHCHCSALLKFRHCAAEGIPWKRGTLCMSCLNGHCLGEHTELSFSTATWALFWGNTPVNNPYLFLSFSMYDQLPYADCHGGSASKRKNLHLKKADTLFKLDWSAYKRWWI